MSTITPADIIRQLALADLLPNLQRLTTESRSVAGASEPGVLIAALRAHPEFKEGVFHGLHPDVGDDRRDFRSHRHAFGPGSLQVVVDATTGRWYADIDAFSPYDDVVSFLGHSGEVLGHWLRRLRRA